MFHNLTKLTRVLSMRRLSIESTAKQKDHLQDSNKQR